MDNSDDDYFNDDLILDDNALAALDAAESQYAATQKRHASSTSIAPVAKRQKAFHERTPPQPLPALQRNISLNDFEDLPDIFVQGDGSYEITPAVRTFGVPTPAPRTQPRTGDFEAPLSRTPPGNKPVSYPVRPPPVPAPPVVGPSNHRQQSQPSRRVSGTQQKVHVNHQTNPPPTRRVTQPHHEFGSQSSRPSQSEGSSNATLKNTISILQAQVEDLKKEQAKMTEALKAAEQARLAKQGEVTILRANIEKVCIVARDWDCSRLTQKDGQTAESHVSEVLRLQAAKEVSEAMRVHLQKEQKEEIERLKTQYKFKVSIYVGMRRFVELIALTAFQQLEMETAARKPPWSVQGKRISRDINMTPMKAPSQMREWNSRGGPHNGVQTPRRPQFGVIDSPVTQRSRRQPPTPAERTPPLPGFYNSFASTPSKAPLLRVKSKGKGKEREIDNNVFFVSGNVNSSPPSSPIRARRDEAEVQDFIMGDAAPLRTNKPVDHPQLSVAVDNDDDVKMGFESEENSPVPNDYSEIEAPDWRNEVGLYLLFLKPDADRDMNASFIVSYSHIRYPLSSRRLCIFSSTTHWDCPQIRNNYKHTQERVPVF
ncbi:hypothetical protein PHLCEN_2v10285 [Hermanssonia centrifuga]|uniref:Uncharacterized protein n=1 Tax=Hermanssonia centrifuga TaxID=98765 RepID=A0A2R6NNE4_9APHY|nr:hypothetical protein PHLCEN_2v10285 [Hermanssonia centrifuga]